MYTPTDFEQEMLELINRARLDPQGEYDALIGSNPDDIGVSANIRNAIRYFDVDLDIFRSQLEDLSPVAPLAWDTALNRAAEAHSAEMIAQDIQAHVLPGEAGLSARFNAAGYTGWRNISENVFAFTEDPLHGHAGFFIDWGGQMGGIQNPPGHRKAILNPLMSEVGIAALSETSAATDVGPWVVTQDFGNRFSGTPRLLGVVLQDADDDSFYDAGEGLGGVRVTATDAEGTTVTTTTWDSGGYQMYLANGTYDVVFSGGELAGTITDTVTISDANVKLDGFAGAVSQDSLVSGGPGNDWLTPGPGNDTVEGGAGTDMVSFVDQRQAVNVDLTTGIALSGPDTNTLDSIENVTGSVHGDYIRGDGGDNLIRGLGGYDWIIGSDGSDSYEGGTGRDMISYVFSASGVTVDLGTGRGLAGQAAGDRYDSIERVTGSIHNDLTYGSDGEDDFRGLGGYDWFVGSGGGKDRYDGGSGYDMVAYTASTGPVVASLALGRGSVGDAARDLYTSIEWLTGSNHGDILTGDAGRNILRGMYGEDTLYGLDGVDRLEGGGSDDVLNGGDGFDYALYAHDRADYFVFTSGDLASVTYLPGGGEGTDLLVEIEAIQFADDILYL